MIYVLKFRRNETWQEAQSVFEKIVTIFPAKIKEVFLVYQYTSGLSPVLWAPVVTEFCYFRGSNAGAGPLCR